MNWEVAIENWDGEGAIRIPEDALRKLGVNVGIASTCWLSASAIPSALCSAKHLKSRIAPMSWFRIGIGGLWTLRNGTAEAAQSVKQPVTIRVIEGAPLMMSHVRAEGDTASQSWLGSIPGGGCTRDVVVMQQS